MAWAAWAQPVNDNCSGLIDLGVIPACDPADVYTNVGATASNIGFGNIPSCFNGGGTERDVWFAFTVGTDFTDVTVSVLGTTTGPNGASIINPQIAIYRGDCEVDGLAELACISAPPGSAQASLDILGLTPGVTYFLRINDYSASASPNSGDFTLCVDEYVPAINIGTSPGSSACFGTLYDSGGPDSDYNNGENHTFVICPSDFHECIVIDLLTFATEAGFDRINFFAGNTTSAPLIASATGIDNGNEFQVLASSDCVTVQFISDGSAVNDGFELTWSCSPLACGGSTPDNPTVVDVIPFNEDFTTCGAGATFATSPCGNDAFLNGPEHVFIYTSPGDVCANISINGAAPGTGVLVLNGPPSAPGSLCLGVGPNGSVNNISFEEPGTYYIVVANAQGCTDFNLNIELGDCSLQPGLADALCNPLNGCIEEGGVPSVFTFQDGFQDMELIAGLNSGCFPTNGVGLEADFYWFTIEAQADGPFGFILQGAGVPSDIDFNVWGPFTSDQTCNTPSAVINAVMNTQPIRSSWTGGNTRTGLADIHPDTGLPVLDDFDCGSPATPGAGGDRFVRTIPALEGQVFVVLVNDFGNLIGEEGISVDWSPSNAEVLAPVAIEVLVGDTVICSGETVQFVINSGIENITWIDPSGTLSCDDCLDPIASPLETTVYKAIVDAVCYMDTIEVEVGVFNLELGPDLTVCRGEDFQIVAGEDFEQASYLWTVPNGLTFSCNDCPAPNVIAAAPGTYTVPATLTGSSCIFFDTLTITVLNAESPEAPVISDRQICEGETITLGGAAIPGVTYTWTSAPSGFTSSQPNPAVSPAETITYFLTTTNGLCPVPSTDSVTVSVVPLPLISVIEPTIICEGDSIRLSSLSPEAGVTYTWSGGSGLTDASDPNTFVAPSATSTYTLVADRLGCTVQESVQITITQISIDITNVDTTRICQGETVQVQTLISPANLTVVWNQPNLNGANFPVTPVGTTLYTATVSTGSCVRADTILIQVDSIPADLAFTLEPAKDAYCFGEQVTITSTIYDPAEYPDIEHEWLSSPGSVTPDSLYNLVFNATETGIFERVTRHRGCVDTTRIEVEVIQPIFPRIVPADTTICQGQSVPLQVVHNQGEDITYEWQDPTTGLSCENCPSPIATPATTVTYQVQTEIDGECPESAATTITVIAAPNPVAPSPRALCPGGPPIVLLTSDPEPGVIYTWTSPDLPGFTSNDPLLAVSPADTITYVLTAVNACFTVTRQVIVLPSAPAGVTINIEEPLQVCEEETLTLSPVFTPAIPSSLVQAISWTTPNGNATSIDFTTNTPASGVYRLSLSVAGCYTLVDSVSIDVIDNPRPTVIEGQVICIGEELQLFTAQPEAGVTYSWTSSADPGFSSTDPLIVVSPSASTTYTLMASNPCSTVVRSVVITVIGNTTLSIEGDLSICPGNGTTLQAVTTPAVDASLLANTVWTWPGGTFTGANLTVNPEEATAYTATLTLADCGEITATATVTILPEPTVEAVAERDTVYSGAEIIIGLTSSPATGNTITWTPQPDSQNGNTYLFTAPTLADTNTLGQLYTVTLVTGEGCQAEATVFITVLPARGDVPNIFSPNGDMLNDRFRIFNADELSDIQIMVYNRWGQLVYESTDNTGWDGNYKGDPAPADVYIYRVRFTIGGETFDKTGELTLVR